MKLFCFDTSAFARIQRFYPSDLFPDLWEIINDMLGKKTIYSHQFVFSELVSKTGKKDEIAKLIIQYKQNFVPISEEQTKLVSEIISLFPKIINPDSEKDQADPWLIATLCEQMKKDQLFGENSLYVLVSEESARSPQRIPAVCNHYEIKHMNLFQFFDHLNLSFSVTMGG